MGENYIIKVQATLQTPCYVCAVYDVDGESEEHDVYMVGWPKESRVAGDEDFCNRLIQMFRKHPPKNMKVSEESNVYIFLIGEAIGWDASLGTLVALKESNKKVNDYGQAQQRPETCECC